MSMNRKAAASCLAILAACSTGYAQFPDGFFTDARPVSGLNLPEPIEDSSLFVTSDGLTAYLSSPRPIGAPGDDGPFDIFFSQRPTVTSPFEVADKLNANVNLDGGNNGGPHLSSDGLRMYFSSRPSAVLPDTPEGRLDLWYSERSSLESEDWGPRTALASLNSDLTDAYPSLSKDELTIVFDRNFGIEDGSRDLYMSSRESIDDAFGDPIPVAAANTSEDEGHASISADGLTLFFARDLEDAFSLGLWVSMRSTTDGSFGEAMRLEDMFPGTDVNDFGQVALFYPFIDRNWPEPGSKLYYSRATVFGDWDFYEATWVVPEPSSFGIVVASGFLFLGIIGRRRMLTAAESGDGGRADLAALG